MNTTRACGFRTALEEMGYPQPKTPVCTDNNTASDLINDRMKQKRSSAFDMRYYWVKDRVNQGQFHIFWRPGKLNLADYFTKHHAPAHHRKMRSVYLTPNRIETSSSDENEKLYIHNVTRGCISIIRDSCRRSHVHTGVKTRHIVRDVSGVTWMDAQEPKVGPYNANLIN